MPCTHLLEIGAEGKFHLGGAEAMSRYDFGKMVKETFSINHAILQSKSQKDLDLGAFRPPNLSLDCRKITSTGFTLEYPSEALKALAKEMPMPPSAGIELMPQLLSGSRVLGLGNLGYSGSVQNS